MNNNMELVKATSDELRTCKSIVYMIVNKINNKAYIGITSQTFRKRYYSDFRNHHNVHLKNAIKKYGAKNFDVILLEKEVESYEQLKKLEMKYIKKIKTFDKKYGYNQTLGGDGVLGLKRSDESKKKMSKKMKGKIRSKEHCENLSKSKMGVNTLAVMTEEQLKERSRKLSIAHSGKNNAMYNRKDKMTPEEYEQWRKSCARPGKNNGMYGKSIKDHMTEDAFEQRNKKISKALSGKSNGRAKSRVVVYQGEKYTFECATDAIKCFRNKGYNFSKEWFFRGIPNKYKDLFQFAGYEEDFNTI